MTDVDQTSTEPLWTPPVSNRMITVLPSTNSQNTFQKSSHKKPAGI